VTRVSTSVGEAADVLRAGGVVAIPTETVYGLAADATNERAVRRIFEIKGRPAEHPLIVHIAGADQVHGWVSELPDAARKLATIGWPGPLTLLLSRAAHVLDVVTGGRDTIGIRVPSHRMTTELLTVTGGLAAPSANRFGRVSPTTATHVVDDLGDAVDLVLDGGPCPIGVESTIVDCTVDPPQVLRSGAITDEQVALILDGSLDASAGPSRAPGMLVTHYAPACEVLLTESRPAADGLAAQAIASGRRAEVLDRTADLAECARTLYSSLRDADHRGLDVLVAVLPPPEGLGHAIRDRLLKAAGHPPH